MNTTTKTVLLSETPTSIRRAWNITNGEELDNRANDFLAKCREQLSADGLSDLDIDAEWLAKLDSADDDFDTDSLVLAGYPL